ncbi:ATP-binding protein [Streptomyces sp. CA-250714]|uniref:sensor histidine kinase n=1 Tax=Streptomyces sp. CA-250714 TaxID=3240060 RepID=UPI003D8C0088
MAESPSYAAPNGIGASHSASLAVPPSEPAGGNVPARRRHGRTRAQARARENAGDAAVRRHQVGLAVLPAGLVAATGAVVVGCVLADRDGTRPIGAALWAVLVVGALLVCGVLGTAGVLAAAEARGTAARCAALRQSLVRGQAELRSMLWALRHGERPVTRTRAPEARPVGDALDQLGHQAALAQCAAESAVVETVALMAEARGGEERNQVFRNLARRLQSLVHREIELIDELEREVEDPELLKGVFHVDHIATRTRRHAENLAVLGGAAAHRQWTRPVPLSEALRSAVAEVEQYTRVQLVPPIEGTVRGHAVADVIHLLAELIENATVFSGPDTQVLVRTQRVTAGIAVEVEDRGLGMDPGVQNRLNAVLAEPGRNAVPELVRDGRIGLYVVSTLARRHGIVVQLQSNIYGGVQAVAVLPQRVLGRPRDQDTSLPPEPAAHPDDELTPDTGPQTGPGAAAVAGAEEDPGEVSRPAPEAAPGSGPTAGSGAAPGSGATAGSAATPGPAADPGSAAGPDPRPRARARGKGRGPATPLPLGSPGAHPEGEAEAERPPLPVRGRTEQATPERAAAPSRRGDGSPPEVGRDTRPMAAAFRRSSSLAGDTGRSAPR